MSFWHYARARYKVQLARNANQKPPWTTDPVLRQWRFCNIFREDDRTTSWFRRNIRSKIKDPLHLTGATIAFRWFNRIETGERIKHVLLNSRYGWDEMKVREALEGVQPIVTGAYMIKTPPGMDKLSGICWCMDEAIHLNVRGMSLQDAHVELMNNPYLGKFMAYEIVTDLRHTPVLNRAPDKMTWASAGPGCARGLEWIYGGVLHYGSASDQEVMLGMMRDLLQQSRSRSNWPFDRQWEMREVEHTLCEYDKFRRAQDGQSLKRRFDDQSQLDA